MPYARLVARMSKWEAWRKFFEDQKRLRAAVRAHEGNPVDDPDNEEFLAEVAAERRADQWREEQFLREEEKSDE